MSIDSAPAREHSAVSLPLGPQLQWEIEQLLYTEAHLLDTRRYEEWLALLSADVRYVMRVLTDRIRRDAVRFTPAPIELRHFDDDRETLELRVRRLRSGTAWSDDPHVRVCHFVSNVRIGPGDSAHELRVWSNLFVHISRMDEPAATFAAVRDDVLRAHGAEWRISSRTITLDETVLSSTNLTFFF